MAKKTTTGFGSFTQGMQIGNLVSKNQTTTTDAFMKGFSGGIQSSGILEKQKVAQAKYDNIMENFNSGVPTVTVEERSQLQPIVDSISKEAQDFAVQMVEDPNSLDAQAGFNSSIQKINRITQAQNAKYANNVNAAKIHQTNSYSSGQDKTELAHAKEIVGNMANRTFDTDGYETYKTTDGTVYDNNPNTPNPPPPIVEGHYLAGHTSVLKSWNSNVKVNNTSSKITQALDGYSVDGQANTIYNDIMSSGPDGSAPTYGNKMDILFGDISGDGQDISFAEMFINSKLGEEYYKDLDGNELMYNGKPISSYPDKTTPTSLDAIGDPTTAQDDTSPNRPTTKAEALEAILRDRNRNDANMRNFSKFYSNTIKTGLEQKKIKLALKDNRVILNMDGEPDTRFGDNGFFDSDASAQDAKKSVYVDMKTDNLIKNFLGQKVQDKKLTERGLLNLFKNETNLKVKPLIPKGGDSVAGVSVYVGVDKFGKGTGKKLQFNFNNPTDVADFKRIIMNEADMFKDLPTLSGDPRKWGIIPPALKVIDEKTAIVPGASDDNKATSVITNEDDETPKTSILESPVSENYNMEQTSGQSNFNIASAPINQGFNFNQSN